MRGRLTSALSATLGASIMLACLDTSNVARTDQPPELLAIEDSLQRERFSGLVVVELPSPTVLRLRFRDPQRCGVPPASLRSFAELAAARAIALRRIGSKRRAEDIDRVTVTMTRTHRFGVVVWTTSLASFDLAADSLPTDAPRASDPCPPRLPPLLRSIDD